MPCDEHAKLASDCSADRAAITDLTVEPDMKRSLDGMSILIVEDEVIIGLMLAQEIGRAGGRAVGPVTSVDDALKELESGMFDLVILDAKLGGSSGAAIAAVLEERQIPFVVVSAYEQAALPCALRQAPFVGKPVSVPFLMDALERLGRLPRKAGAAPGYSGPRQSAPARIDRAGDGAIGTQNKSG